MVALVGHSGNAYFLIKEPETDSIQIVVESMDKLLCFGLTERDVPNLLAGVCADAFQQSLELFQHLQDCQLVEEVCAVSQLDEQLRFGVVHVNDEIELHGRNFELLSPE